MIRISGSRFRCTILLGYCYTPKQINAQPYFVLFTYRFNQMKDFKISYLISVVRYCSYTFVISTYYLLKLHVEKGGA